MAFKSGDLVKSRTTGKVYTLSDKDSTGSPAVTPGLYLYRADGKPAGFQTLGELARNYEKHTGN